jgi:lipopolysaccharide transport system ATP-binding protein
VAVSEGSGPAQLISLTEIGEQKQEAMNDIAIRADALSKQYKIGMAKKRHDTLRDEITDALLALFRSPAGNGSRLGHSQDTIWALKDVSFEIKKGDVVGLIGRNGAGKSTLLKILSRITTPTSGSAEIFGRVASLLEVGTGFHGELTGRENVYLNGAILGMKKWEIDKKFDEIVAFSEVEQFIDTPLKRYSSGMQVRLAFAVAANLEPEILIVDEVLAVGDAAFQKKCLGKMDDVAKKGRTVLFVSHNMLAVKKLCARALLLEAGHAVADGLCETVVENYFDTLSNGGPVALSQRTDREGDQRLKFLTYRVLDRYGHETAVIAGQDFDVVFEYESKVGEPLKSVHVAIGINGRYAERLIHFSTNVSGQDFAEIPAKGVIICHIPHLPLRPGKYSFNLFSTVSGEISDWIQDAGSFEVMYGDFFGSGRLPPPDGSSFLAEHRWEARSISSYCKDHDHR